MADCSYNAGATAEQTLAQDTKWTEINELARIAYLQMSNRSLKEDIAFYQAGEKDSKRKLARATMNTTSFVDFFENTRAQVIYMQGTSAAKEKNNPFNQFKIVCNACVTPRSFVQNFPADLNKPIPDAFRKGFIEAQFYANSAIDGISRRA